MTTFPARVLSRVTQMFKRSSEDPLGLQRAIGLLTLIFEHLRRLNICRYKSGMDTCAAFLIADQDEVARRMKPTEGAA
jgi:hypothetical protein